MSSVERGASHHDFTRRRTIISFERRTGRAPGRCGRSPTRLRDRALREAGLAEYALDTTKPIRHPQRATPHKRNRSDGGHSEGTRSRVLVGSRGFPPASPIAARST